MNVKTLLAVLGVAQMVTPAVAHSAEDTGFAVLMTKVNYHYTMALLSTENERAVVGPNRGTSILTN